MKRYLLAPGKDNIGALTRGMAGINFNYTIRGLGKRSLADGGTTTEIEYAAIILFASTTRWDFDRPPLSQMDLVRKGGSREISGSRLRHAQLGYWRFVIPISTVIPSLLYENAVPS